jgi:hypothetical protein
MAYQQMSMVTNGLEVLDEAPPGLTQMPLSKNEYQEDDKQQMDKRVDGLEALMVCVENLHVIERTMDTLDKKLKAKTLPQPQWYKKESKSHAGRFYWVNRKSGETSWKVPEDWQEPESDADSMQASTDAGYTSVSDYDSDVARPVTSSQRSGRTTTGFSAEAPVFKLSATTGSEGNVFRADAPVFQPREFVVATRDTFLSHRLFVTQRDGISAKAGDVTMRASADIAYC